MLLDILGAVAVIFLTYDAITSRASNNLPPLLVKKFEKRLDGKQKSCLDLTIVFMGAALGLIFMSLVTLYLYVKNANGLPHYFSIGLIQLALANLSLIYSKAFFLLWQQEGSKEDLKNKTPQ